MGYWDGAAPRLIRDSIADIYARDADGWEKELTRFADYRDGRSSIIGDTSRGYFKKRKRENNARFADRPKISVPLCPLIIDVHNEALTKSVKIEFEDEATAEVWAEVSEHNDLPGYWGRKPGPTLGTFGHAIVRPVLHDDGTPEKVLEFDCNSPLECRLIYERSAAGRSVPHFHGVTIHTGYSIENGDSLPWPVKAELREQLNIKHRVEFISKDYWLVWLDDELVPESPWGDVWMPTKKDDANFGANPYGFIPASLFNGLETEESFLGQSDIAQAVYDVQVVNEIWSDVVYSHRMYVPVPVLKTKNKDSVAAFTAGIGAGIVTGSDAGEDFKFASPGLDFKNVMEPMSAAMELALANAKTPAMSVGLGHIFGSAARTVNTPSGVAKAMEWKSTERHAIQKRESFRRGVKDLVRKSLRYMEMDPPYGQGKKVDPETTITVSFPGDIIPTSAAERLERFVSEQLAHAKSLYQGLIDYHGWSTERAQRELDMMAAEKRAHLVEMGFKHIVDAVQERQSVTIDAAALERDKEKLFAGMTALASDVTANEEEDRKKQEGKK
jgi:hypothetical protein